MNGPHKFSDPVRPSLAQLSPRYLQRQRLGVRLDRRRIACASGKGFESYNRSNLELQTTDLHLPGVIIDYSLPRETVRGPVQDGVVAGKAMFPNPIRNSDIRLRLLLASIAISVPPPKVRASAGDQAGTAICKDKLDRFFPFTS